jgi:hypothetical protein
MMNRLLTAAPFALGFLLAASNQSAWAQYGPFQPYGRTTTGYNPAARAPLLSPYLDLRRNAATNYYLGTIPEEQRRFQYRQLSSEIQNLERQIPAAPVVPEEDQLPRLSETGHGATFMNMSPYYTFGPPSAATGAAAQTRAQAPAPRRGAR